MNLYDEGDDGFNTGDDDHECERCGKGGLHGEDFGSGFRLYDPNGKKHACHARKPSADDFDTLS